MFIKRKQFIAIDQHAADERIQLEALFDLYDNVKMTITAIIQIIIQMLVNSHWFQLLKVLK